MFDATPVMFPTWDRLAYSQQSFDNLLSVTPNAQFVMYDDGSGDGTREWIMEQDDPRIVGKILRKERQGIDAQMDLFFSITPGVQFVAKIDNDTIMSTGWLERLMEVAVSAKLDVIAPTHFKNDTAIAKYLSHKKRREVDGCVYYLNHHVGGLVVIRRSWLDLALDAGRTSYYDRFGITPGGWTHFQEQTPGAKAFYPDVYAELLDLQRGPGADYPKYNQKLNRERVVKYGRPPEAQ
jgi:glycosyltransferase involved in cell wall biosynthesis